MFVSCITLCYKIRSYNYHFKGSRSELSITKKNPKRNVMKRQWSQNLPFWLRNGLKLLWLLALVTCDKCHATCNMRRMARDMWHMTFDTWNLIPETWHLTPEYFFLILSLDFFYIDLIVLPSGHIERFSVSSMRDFLCDPVFRRSQ